MPAWCDSIIPGAMYAAVQAQYWDVGFLRYYQWQKVPNFVLAAPAVACSLALVVAYARDWLPTVTLRRLWHKRTAVTAGVRGPHSGLLASLLPEVVHLAVLTVTAVTMMHIEVSCNQRVRVC